MCYITEVTTIIKTQNKIVKAAAKSNFCRQCKTEETPLRIALLLQEFGYFADNKENVDVVLNRTYVIPPGIDQYAKEFIETLGMPNFIQRKNPITLLVTSEEHKKRLEKTETINCVQIYCSHSYTLQDCYI